MQMGATAIHSGKISTYSPLLSRHRENKSSAPDVENADQALSELSVIIFLAGGTFFALPTMTVSEVVNIAKIIPLPGAPSIIEGVIELRGEIIPILDLRKKLGMIIHANEKSTAVIISFDNRRVAFIVDSVRIVTSFSVSETKDISAGIDIDSRYIFKTTCYLNEPLIILDIGALISAEDRAALQTVHKAIEREII